MDIRITAELLLVAWMVGAAVSCSRSEPRGHLRDSRDLLSTASERRIEALQAYLLAGHDIELAIDVPDVSPEDLEGYAHALMEQMEVGSMTTAGRGLLLVIDVGSSRVRFEVGPDLEHVFPDAVVSRVENDQMAPFFREARVGDGIEATVELLVARAKEAAPRGHDSGTDVPKRDYSAGAGATADAPVGTGDVRSSGRVSGPAHGPEATPDAVLATYVGILSARDARTDLGIYTRATRELLAERLITPAQQDNEYRTLVGRLAKAHYVESDSFAVALFDSEELPPYFFRRGPGGWMLDLATPAGAIRFDQDNRWFFVEPPSGYAFAFER